MNTSNNLNKDYNSILSTPKKTRKCYTKDNKLDKSNYSQLYSGCDYKPPPSYKMAKYLPSAVILKNLNDSPNNAKSNKNERTCTPSTNQYIHIYENIDDYYLSNRDSINNENKSDIFETNIINMKDDVNSFNL